MQANSKSYGGVLLLCEQTESHTEVFFFHASKQQVIRSVSSSMLANSKSYGGVILFCKQTASHKEVFFFHASKQQVIGKVSSSMQTDSKSQKLDLFVKMVENLWSNNNQPEELLVFISLRLERKR